ncbi:hypothetical protein SLS56_011887 [Neofusicoccum ribis]|uniref:Fumarylacetoacetase-like C-terminal domain-containing protein n=1 Tax=Neofusicoccum ribis TaxID=45134 RepID=A0ABR3SAC6_9PEZI
MVEQNCRKFGLPESSDGYEESAADGSSARENDGAHVRELGQLMALTHLLLPRFRTARDVWALTQDIDQLLCSEAAMMRIQLARRAGRSGTEGLQETYPSTQAMDLDLFKQATAYVDAHSVMSAMEFTRLVRFEEEGQIYYGDLLESSSTSVETLLCPLERTPIVQCVGVNYQKHAAEAKVGTSPPPKHGVSSSSLLQLSVPKYPVIFTKPADALAGPHQAIPIHADAQAMLDYESELAVVVERDAKDVDECDALDYVLGYAASNDISARNFQVPDASGGQYSYAKSFDCFAPVGPAIVSPRAVPNPQSLTLVTRVNGEERQRTDTDDIIWSVRQIIAHLSRGTTLRAGTVIMTGTPAGVGFFHKKFLKDDVVEVEIEGLGTIANRMAFT